MQRALTLVTALVLVAFGVASVVKGLDGRATVRDSLKQEKVVGLPHMTPKAIGPYASKFGLKTIDTPDCSVAGQRVDDGDSARCFTHYMRIDALIATGGKTYAEMPSFLTERGNLTDDITKAKIVPGTGSVTNPARAVWVTETALATALNASYMADEISLFGIGTGIVMLLLGLVLGALAIRNKA